MRLSLIAAMADNLVIGIDGKIPWHLPEDLRNFKNITMGAPILMGRKTFQSIGRPLPGRQNYVLTHDRNFSASNVKVFHNLDFAIKEIRAEASRKQSEDAFIIGGAEIYAHTINLADRLYLTEVHIKPEGDTWFPLINYDEWREVHRNYVNDKNNAIPPYTFKIFDKAQK